ncbi:hypothetical protein AAZX31_06G089500 [Glycine max]|nr:uncharacterized protein LOC100793605 [Glycine max]XP_028235624.1 uncharacterized protein LOC114415230 [Glycine soja]KAG4389431.1 hypothetical protein GLYMA_06G093700v4 [Glycine max]KAG5031192.1 hypothetical protein JHK85_015174 [Glycine max]KAG5045417.1 hypothetical protein JHK86_014823 [Glycine max]KAG5147926.1 hypothetical protein JHK82_014807 [Glycine max]KAH1124977.1 hypothetical protein GYH30_014565 [Glycine max]|eukprot:XP_003527872.3 uncharacterized protein LOC100793605 [Glycine max]
MMKTRYRLPLLAFFAFASFIFITRSSLLEKISSTMPEYSFNTDQVLSILFRELTNNQEKMVFLGNNEPNLVVAAPRKLCGYMPEAKKVALQKLEDVLLEPPRASSGKSRKYLKRTRFLPDLMNDSLEKYPRRVFIDVGVPEKDGGSGMEWFSKNYPTRNQKFEMYNIETVAEESSSSSLSPGKEQIEMSDWVRKNVKEEEYVVMKAEAEVVEEMMKSKSIGLVDELFLECKPKRENRSSGNSSRRAYWECLALYGKLRDEGVAVHQWWG